MNRVECDFCDRDARTLSSLGPPSTRRFLCRNHAEDVTRPLESPKNQQTRALRIDHAIDALQQNNKR